MKSENILLLGLAAAAGYALYKFNQSPVSEFAGGGGGGYSSLNPTPAQVAVTAPNPITGVPEVTVTQIKNTKQGVGLINDMLQGKIKINTGAQQIIKPVTNANGSKTGVSRLGTGQIVKLTVTKVA